MHHSAMENGRRFFTTYVANLGPVTILDIGSLDVNGSLRSVAPEDAKYVGIDFAKGKGVDIVLDDPYKLPFEDNSQDVVVSSSCFEHSEMFWLVFSEVMRVLKPHGLFYVNAPSNGTIHRYPVDCWRFYPDSGLALVTWARRCGFNSVLLESYTSLQIKTTFNDFVGVFLKDEAHIKRYPERILDTFKDFNNGRIAGRTKFLKPQQLPEDQQRLKLIFGCLNGNIKME